MEPFECRLSPRQPGYVMTVWQEARVERRARKVVAMDSHDGEVSSIMGVDVRRVSSTQRRILKLTGR